MAEAEEESLQTPGPELEIKRPISSGEIYAWPQECPGTGRARVPRPLSED